MTHGGSALRTANRVQIVGFGSREEDLDDVGQTQWWSVGGPGPVSFQFTGDATDFTAYVYRSTRDPAQGSDNAVLADSAPITGDPSSGQVPIAVFDEPGVGFWQVDVTVLTGGSLTVAMTSHL